MKNREIFDLALRLLSEGGDIVEDGDLYDRAPYLLAAFCTEVSEADAAYRKSRGEEVGACVREGLYCAPDEDFPCDLRFAAAAGYYLAAMLALDENEGLSERLFSRYHESVREICARMPAVRERILNRYGR